jgi:hypothetical protein
MKPMLNENEVPGDELGAALRKYTKSVSELIQTHSDAATTVIDVVREYLQTLPRKRDDPDSRQNAVSDDERTLLVHAKLAQDVNSLGPLGQMQSLSMLAAAVIWLSAETGRSETEILDQLAETFVD